ncbi:DUF317 domain-containing protein [Streptomyces sp. NPDC016566]|uniref:DUF317 domain-containing protein n=2 Tax=unclassified Streptomyces TaxID=2593676 RepID=UPI003702ED2B
MSHQEALLRLEPDPDGRWWTLHNAPGPDRPAWYASFGARTPVEIIAAFNDALTDPTAAGHESRLRDHERQGWTTEFTPDFKTGHQALQAESWRM